MEHQVKGTWYGSAFEELKTGGGAEDPTIPESDDKQMD